MPGKPPSSLSTADWISSVRMKSASRIGLLSRWSAERQERIRSEGEEAWSARVQGSVEILRGRLGRPDGERFRRPSRAEAASYDVGGVDALCRRLLARFEGQDPLDANEVRRAVFSAARGAEGYDEAQVDAFLDASIDVLTVLD